MTTKTTKGISFPIKIGTSILLEEGHVFTEQTIKELHLGFEYERQKREEAVEAERKFWEQIVANQKVEIEMLRAKPDKQIFITQPNNPK